MMKMSDKIFQSLGDRLKAQERTEAGRCADNSKPLMCRLDGRSFHTFTKGLTRPYHESLSNLMIDTTKFLVKETHAKLGYTQSDEITLYWELTQNSKEINSAQPEYLFKGKYQKIASVTAGLASAYFNKHLSECIPEKAHFTPVFDSRVWQVENSRDVFLNFLWRQQDAIKNSISMAAQTHFSAKQLHGVNSQHKKELLKDIGHPWELLPESFKSGTFVKRFTREVELTEAQLSAIPEPHRSIEERFAVRTEVQAVWPRLLLQDTDYQDWLNLSSSSNL